MKWKSPVDNETRKNKRFCFLPHNRNGKTYWLTFIYTNERYSAGMCDVWFDIDTGESYDQFGEILGLAWSVIIVFIFVAAGIAWLQGMVT